MSNAARAPNHRVEIARAEARRVRDFLEFTGRGPIQFPLDTMSEAHRAELRIGLGKLFEPFETLMGFDDAELFEIVTELMQGAFLIGALATVTEAAKLEGAKLVQRQSVDEIRVNQAALMRQRNASNAAARKATKLRPAILEAAAAMGGEMNATRKYAESIGGAVRAIAGADSGARGFSDRSIQREIESILRECTSGRIHS